MPLLPREDEGRTPRTRRQVEMDAARQRSREEEEHRDDVNISAGIVTASGVNSPDVNMSALLASMQQLMQANHEANQKMASMQEMMKTSQEANQKMIQISQEAVVGKIDAGIIALGEKVKSLEDRVEVLDKEVTMKTGSLEDRLQKITLKNEAMEDRWETLNKEVMKLRTHGSIAVASPSSAKVDLPRFDGTSSWSAFKYQFEVLASGNGWNNEQSFMALTLALRGDALTILENLPPERRTLETLMEALDTRYSDKHLEHVYRVQLRERSQKAGESLQQWAQEIERLVRRAYSSAPEVIEVTLLQAFIDGIRNSEVRGAVKLGHHQALKNALAHALEVEAVQQDTRLHKVRAMIPEEKKSRFVPTCYECGEKGHIRLECPKKKRRVKDSETQDDQDSPLN